MLSDMLGRASLKKLLLGGAAAVAIYLGGCARPQAVPTAPVLAPAPVVAPAAVAKPTPSTTPRVAAQPNPAAPQASAPRPATPSATTPSAAAPKPAASAPVVAKPPVPTAAAKPVAPSAKVVTPAAKTPPPAATQPKTVIVTPPSATKPSAAPKIAPPSAPVVQPPSGKVSDPYKASAYPNVVEPRYGRSYGGLVGGLIRVGNSPELDNSIFDYWNSYTQRLSLWYTKVREASKKAAKEQKKLVQEAPQFLDRQQLADMQLPLEDLNALALTVTQASVMDLGPIVGQMARAVDALPAGSIVRGPMAEHLYHTSGMLSHATDAIREDPDFWRNSNNWVDLDSARQAEYNYYASLSSADIIGTNDITHKILFHDKLLRQDVIAYTVVQIADAASAFEGVRTSPALTAPLTQEDLTAYRETKVQRALLGTAFASASVLQDPDATPEETARAIKNLRFAKVDGLTVMGQASYVLHKNRNYPAYGAPYGNFSREAEKLRSRPENLALVGGRPIGPQSNAAPAGPLSSQFGAYSTDLSTSRGRFQAAFPDLQTPPDRYFDSFKG